MTRCTRKSTTQRTAAEAGEREAPATTMPGQMLPRRGIGETDFAPKFPVRPEPGATPDRGASTAEAPLSVCAGRPARAAGHALGLGGNERSGSFVQVIRIDQFDIAAGVTITGAAARAARQAQAFGSWR